MHGPVSAPPARRLPAIALAALALTLALGCAKEPEVPGRFELLKQASLEVPGRGHADVRYERLSRDVESPPSWLQVAGGESGKRWTWHYRVLTVELGTGSGKPVRVRWIGPPSESELEVPLRLALADGDLFIELAHMPYAAAARPIEPGAVLERRRYAGTQRARRRWYSDSYAWRVEWLWDPVDADRFEEAVASGVVVDLRDAASERDREYLALYLATSDAERFLAAVATGQRELAAGMLYRNRSLALARDDQGRTALHLTLERDPRRMAFDDLLLFAASVDAIDYSGRTPLHVAAARDLRSPTEALLARGGQVPYPDCSFWKDDHQLPRRRIHLEALARDGWVSDDVYQRWERCDPDCAANGALERGRRRIAAELLRPGAAGTEAARALERAVDRAFIACHHGMDGPANRRLVRVAAPGLRKLAEAQRSAGPPPGR